MSFVAVAVATLVLMLLAKLLNLNSAPQMPRLHGGDVKFIETINKHCPTLTQVYRPTALWGLSGHVQTVVHAMTSCFHSGSRQQQLQHHGRRRRCVTLADGAQLTWDEWAPLDSADSTVPDGITLAVCPGIANSSETAYILSFVGYACRRGYRCIVLNHLGALSSVPLRSPRIFGYGRTEELAAMLCEHQRHYPAGRVLLVGFSMGGNIVTKYLAETAADRQSHQSCERPPAAAAAAAATAATAAANAIIGAITICQGYDAQRCLNSMQTCYLRRFYVLMITERLKSIILRHRATLLADEIRTRHRLDERRILTASTLFDLDEAYTRRVSGYTSLDHFYSDNSSCHYLHHIDLPIVFINARDDPLVPEHVMPAVRRHCLSCKRALLIETEHGGHLGFHEGGVVLPRTISWLDRTVLDLANALASSSSPL